jgi:hypothetical protein
MVYSSNSALPTRKRPLVKISGKVEFNTGARISAREHDVFWKRGMDGSEATVFPNTE